MTDLKPCPFCHGEVELRPKMDGHDETYLIHCMKCHMCFEKFDYRAMDEEKIIKEWNRRAEE